MKTTLISTIFGWQYFKEDYWKYQLNAEKFGDTEADGPMFAWKIEGTYQRAIDTS